MRRKTHLLPVLCDGSQVGLHAVQLFFEVRNLQAEVFLVGDLVRYLLCSQLRQWFGRFVGLYLMQ